MNDRQRVETLAVSFAKEFEKENRRPLKISESVFLERIREFLLVRLYIENCWFVKNFDLLFGEDAKLGVFVILQLSLYTESFSIKYLIKKYLTYQEFGISLRTRLKIKNREYKNLRVKLETPKAMALCLKIETQFLSESSKLKILETLQFSPQTLEMTVLLETSVFLKKMQKYWKILRLCVTSKAIVSLKIKKNERSKTLVNFCTCYTSLKIRT